MTENDKIIKKDFKDIASIDIATTPYAQKENSGTIIIKEISILKSKKAILTVLVTIFTLYCLLIII